MELLMRIPGILMRLASRWVSLRLQMLSLEPTVLAGLEQYSQATENASQSSNASTRWDACVASLLVDHLSYFVGKMFVCRKAKPAPLNLVRVDGRRSCSG
jgi:hypothetical protein